jgi:hypothetical protein
MKNLIVLFCLNLGLLLNISAQNCPYETSVPEEMFRGRYTEADMTYGPCWCERPLVPISNSYKL